jgi:pimeloyl-ACP methyl ester carboxylesterase
MAWLGALGLVGVGLAGLALALTAWVVQQATHPPHGAFDAPRLGDALVREPVTLISRDGTRLSAWFIAGARPQTLLVLHGYTACKADMLSHAAFLHAAGYSLLLLDLRACGESGGRAVTLGGREQEDVAAALAYLQTRPDVDAAQLGILGLSLGGGLPGGAGGGGGGALPLAPERRAPELPPCDTAAERPLGESGAAPHRVAALHAGRGGGAGAGGGPPGTLCAACDSRRGRPGDCDYR